jgi:PAS domain S-box-containing protein
MSVQRATDSDFGDYLRKRRLALYAQDRRFSVRQLAQRLGVEPSYLSKIERGEGYGLSEEKTIALARELDEDPDFLLALSGKISSDVQAEIRRRPTLFARLVRDLKDMPDHRIQVDRTYRFLEDRLSQAEFLAGVGVWERNLRTGEDYWSQELFRLFGYETMEIEPSYEAFMEHVRLDGAAFPEFERQKQFHGPTLMDIEVAFIRRDGVLRDGQWRVDVLRDSAGSPTRLVGALQDITDHKRLEAELATAKRRAFALTNALAVSDERLRVTHSRVKDNLQIISGLLQTSALNARSPETKKLACGVKAMIETIALIHSQLYRQGHQGRVDMGAFASGLLLRMREQFGKDCSSIEPVVNVEKVRVPVEQAVSCGLILNEAVANVYKHAFPDGKPGKIYLDVLSPSPGVASLRLADNGVGFPPGISSSLSLGFGLIRSLAQQLGASLHIASDSGTKLEWVFPIKPIRYAHGHDFA